MTQSQPPITRTTHTLPFDQLSPRDFERLCLWLVEREGYERAELVPQDPNDEPAWVLLERIRAQREADERTGKAGRKKRQPQQLELL